MEITLPGFRNAALVQEFPPHDVEVRCRVETPRLRLRAARPGAQGFPLIVGPRLVLPGQVHLGSDPFRRQRALVRWPTAFFPECEETLVVEVRMTAMTHTDDRTEVMPALLGWCDVLRADEGARAIYDLAVHAQADGDVPQGAGRDARLLPPEGLARDAVDVGRDGLVSGLVVSFRDGLLD